MARRAIAKKFGVSDGRANHILGTAFEEEKSRGAVGRSEVDIACHALAGPNFHPF